MCISHIINSLNTDSEPIKYAPGGSPLQLKFSDSQTGGHGRLKGHQQSF
jgi:hypothetical protein